MMAADLTAMGISARMIIAAFGRGRAGLSVQSLRMEMRFMCNNTNYRAFIFICYSCHAIRWHCQDTHCQGPFSCYWFCLVDGTWLPPRGGELNLHRQLREFHGCTTFDDSVPALPQFLPGHVLIPVQEALSSACRGFSS